MGFLPPLVHCALIRVTHRHLFLEHSRVTLQSSRNLVIRLQEDGHGNSEQYGALKRGTMFGGSDFIVWQISVQNAALPPTLLCVTAQCLNAPKTPFPNLCNEGTVLYLSSELNRQQDITLSKWTLLYAMSLQALWVVLFCVFVLMAPETEHRSLCMPTTKLCSQPRFSDS